jgi:hypothetical protein
VLEIEKLHGRTSNSIRQELFAVGIMSIIARTLMVLTSRVHGKRSVEFQFKNAIMTLAAEAAIFVSDDPQKSSRGLFRDSPGHSTSQVLPGRISATYATRNNKEAPKQMVLRQA